MTKIISVCNQKGGCGKTTLSTTLASGLVSRGYKVALIDSDPQRSSGDWAAQAATLGKRTPLVIGMDRPTIADELKNLPPEYDYAVIDSISGLSPFSQKIIAGVIKASNLVIVPIVPSQVDVWASASVIEMIQARHELTDNQPAARLFMNLTRKGTRLREEVSSAIVEFGFPVFASEFPLSEEIRRLTGEGASIFALRKGDSLRDAGEALIDEVLEAA